MSGQNKADGRSDKDAGNLKGTLASVLIVGALLAASWLTVFFIFLMRNGG